MAVQLTQSRHEGFEDRPVNSLSKARAKIALAQGHSDCQPTAHIVPGALGRMGKYICLNLCPCLYSLYMDITKKKKKKKKKKIVHLSPTHGSPGSLPESSCSSYFLVPSAG